MSDSDKYERPNLLPIAGGKERRILKGNEIENIPPPESLVGELLDKDSIAILYGGWGQYKSFLAMDWAWSIACGRKWNNLTTAQGPVLYFIGEGFSGVGVRQAAWKQYHNLPNANPDVFWAEGIPSVTTAAGRRELREIVLSVNPVLTVIDTVARSVAGIPENDSETMSRVVDALDQVRVDSNGGTAIGVHHAGRSEDMHMRGHSSLDAGVDTILQMHQGRLYVEKQRNHEAHYTYARFKAVKLAGSLVLEVENETSTYTENERRILDASAAIGPDAPYQGLKTIALARGVPEGSFDRVLRKLVERGVMVRSDGGDGGSVYSRG